MKFNTQKSSTRQTRNHEGAKAFVMNPEMQLYTAVVTWSLNDTFYEKNDERLHRVRALIASCDPLFVARLAVYARHKMYMRSAPLVLLTELARIHSGDNLIARTTEKVIARADEITELLACYQLLNERTGLKKLNRFSKQLQKGLSAAFNRFDEYQFSKYNRNGDVKLRDALFLVHPKAKDEMQQMLFDKIAGNKLETAYTWETELSALGQNHFENETSRAEAFKHKWEELIDSNKVGYMAMLRNLRNILQAGVSYGHLQKVCEIISSAEKVAKAKQFPFRYLAAYRELQAEMQVTAPHFSDKIKNLLFGNTGYTGDLLEALEKAAARSAASMAGFDQHTRVLLACDVSGSMQMPVSPKSKIQLFDIGLMLAMLLRSRSKNVVVGMFGDKWKTITVPKNSILANVQEFYKRTGEVGYATNGYLVIKDLLKRKIIMDKVMLFTDCQLWNSNGSPEHIHALWIRYKREIAPDAKLYLFDLRGYGQPPLQLVQNDVYLLAGWSDKIFDVLHALENGHSALHEINSVML
ncbi:TROVE domain-containing protein [Dyadobacter flavalbus]|uniref:TROVE domain-containing protein n=1 Tax=Dyadobacter flavalbus TaxID=2579942 RepID=A0A5M8QP82_9BACT|nr:TROVE domain-containing protein [Dyadobacter flavalbus]KAA6437041.1 TROVE domain-containing protein [Dyadobacter flavalbus]